MRPGLTPVCDHSPSANSVDLLFSVKDFFIIGIFYQGKKCLGLSVLHLMKTNNKKQSKKYKK